MDSLRRMGNSLLGLAQTRLELFALEFQEEKLRAVTLMAWFAVAIAFGAAGVLVAIGAVALFLWKTAGYLGLAGLALGSLGVAAGLLWSLHRRILHGPTPFAATIAEFRKDEACLRPPP